MSKARKSCCKNLMATLPHAASERERERETDRLTLYMHAHSRSHTKMHIQTHHIQM